MAKSTTNTAPEKSVGPSINMFKIASAFAERQLAEESGMQELQATQSMLLSEGEFISFHKPMEILTSKHYPGYRMFDLSGANAAEALGLLLSLSLDSESSLEAFRHLLATPSIAHNVIMKLFPRPGVPLKRGAYATSENQIADTVTSELANLTSDSNVISAVTHVFVRVLSAMKLVLPDPDKKFVVAAGSLALTLSDMKRIIMLESLRDVFSDAMINSEAARLDQNATPNLIAEVIAGLLRRTSRSIPEIRLRLEQLDIVQALVHQYYKRPASLSNTIRASSSLATLAGYANFLADSVSKKMITEDPRSNSDMSAACSAILTLIQSAPSVESIALSKFASYFGSVPCSSTEGIFRGLVTYLPLSQTSKLDIVDAYAKKNSSELALVPSEYVPSTSIAKELSAKALAPDAFAGLANLVADEISNASWALDDTPILRTIGVSMNDLIYLAMDAAEVTAVMSTGENEPFKLIFASKVEEHWRTRLGAATPDIAYFDNPASVLVYAHGSTSTEPTALPARAQSIDVTSAYDTTYVGDTASFLIGGLELPYSFSLDLANPDPSLPDIELKCRVSLLELLVGAGTEVDRGGATYSIVKEPGVDRDLAISLSLAAAYAGSKNAMISDKAKSWIVEVLTPLATHPAITRMAIRAVNESVIKKGIDARRFAPQYKKVLVRAYFGTLFGLLNRFGKIDSDLVKDLMLVLPTESLTVRAALAMASMPTKINASNLYEG
jgi:hypothetical protein